MSDVMVINQGNMKPAIKQAGNFSRPQENPVESFMALLTGLTGSRQAVDYESLSELYADLSEESCSELDGLFKKMDDSEAMEALLAYLAGCSYITPQYDWFQSFQVEGAEGAQAALNLGSGILDVQSGFLSDQTGVWTDSFLQTDLKADLSALLSPHNTNTAQAYTAMIAGAQGLGQNAKDDVIVMTSADAQQEQQLTFLSDALDPIRKAELTQNQAGKALVSEPMDVEKLQKAVDEGAYQANSLWQLGNRSIAEAKPEVQINPEQKAAYIDTDDLIQKLQTNVSQHLSDQTQEFVIKLKPEHLGEITIHLTQDNQQMVLSLTAASETTAKLLNGQLNVLSEALRPYNAQVQPVITQAEAGQSANLLQDGGFLHSGQQSFAGYAREHGAGYFRSYGASADFIEADASPVELQTSKLRQQGLDRYI